MTSETGRSPDSTLKIIRHRRRPSSSRSVCSVSQRGFGLERRRLRFGSRVGVFFVFCRLVAGILVLLWQLDGAGLFVVDMDFEPRARSGDAEVAITEPSDEIEGLTDRLLVRETDCVVGHALLHRLAYVGGGSEESVRRHEPRQRLVGPLEVVSVDEESEPAYVVSEVREDRPAEELVPQRLPKSLCLAERLRMLRATAHVPDAVLA
jgi:hypothetical protein